MIAPIKTVILHLVVLCVLPALLPSCHKYTQKEPSIIRIKGSDTVLILAQSLAEHYMIGHAGISIHVEGGGTAVGARELVNGNIDICTASRPLQPEEIQGLARNFGRIGVAHAVAKDALSIYLNQQNPVDNLTMNQLKQIYTGRITNWRQVGGDDALIILLNRTPNSGTYLYFKEHILEGENYSDSILPLPTTALIVKNVATNRYAIGFGGIAYAANVKHCRVNGIEPTQENVMRDLYPITRYLFLYTIDRPQGIVKDFITWVISPEGQEVVRKVGYFPIWEGQ